MIKYFCDWCGQEILHIERALRIQATAGNHQDYAEPERAFDSNTCAIAALQLDQQDLEWKKQRDVYFNRFGGELSDFTAKYGTKPSGQRARPVPIFHDQH